MAKKPSPKKGKKSVSIIMDRELLEGLSRVAKARSCSVSSVIRVAVAEALEVAK